MTTFAGFEKPKANFFKVPCSFWDIEDLTIHEKFVLLYILRHTWGYQEFDITKHITVDEFQHGRKQKDGTRMDKGCGVSRGGISNALKKLEQLGYILIETDDSDAARIKKSYMLNMAKDSVHHMNTEFTESTQRSSDDTQRSPDSPRTEKDTKKDTKDKITPIPLREKQIDVELAEMEKAVGVELKQSNKTQRRNVAKTLLKRHNDPDKDIEIAPITPEQLKQFGAWWDETKKDKSGKPLTRPKNMGSVKSWVDEWQKGATYRAKELDLQQRNVKRPLNYDQLVKDAS